MIDDNLYVLLDDTVRLATTVRIHVMTSPYTSENMLHRAVELEQAIRRIKQIIDEKEMAIDADLRDEFGERRGRA